MKKILIIIAVGLLSCNKETVIPTTPTIPVSDTTSIDTSVVIPIIQDSLPIEKIHLFESNLDDSLYINSDTIDEFGYLYNENGFIVRIDNIEPDSIKIGSYTNEYLVSNASYGLNLIHTVILGDGSKAQITLGSTATQINTLEVTKLQNDSVWINYDIDWTYTHWQYTEKNKSGNIKCLLNGLKYR